MSEIPLKRIVRKKDVLKVITSMKAFFRTPFQILDIDGAVIFGDSAATGSTKFPIKAWDEDIGWVAGDREAEVLATVLSYMAKTEHEKKALGAETLEKYKEITLLYDIAERLASCLDVGQVSRLIIDEVIKLVKSDSISVMLLDRETGLLKIIAASGEDFSPKTEMKPGEGIAGSVLMTGKAEIVNDVHSDKRFIPGANKVSSLICAPMKIKDDFVGLINLSCQEPYTYDAEDLKLLTALASQSAVAIENARLYEDLRKTFISTVYGLARAIGQRDPFTGKHTKRVMEFSTAIGREMGLPDKEIQSIQLAAILHDIGKIAIPDEILEKKGQLTESELATFKKHPVIGEELVKDIKQLDHIIPGIRHHHECFNGSGYPDGIGGESISILARIIAVADAFDAMTSDRSYRKGLQRVLALDELKKNAGKQFDAEVVKAFLRVFRKKPELFKET